LASVACFTCGRVAPLCPACIQDRLELWGPTAREFGWRWGSGLRVTMDQSGEARPWPAWWSDEAAKVRRYCRRIVLPLAGGHADAPDRADVLLTEFLAFVCGAAAAEAYSTLSVDEARRLVADYDRRHPQWRRLVAERLKAG
jgi:hypothetical protein